MFECTTDQFLIHLATAGERERDSLAVLEEAVDGLGPHAPVSPRQLALLDAHLHRRADRARADGKWDPHRIPEAA